MSISLPEVFGLNDMRKLNEYVREGWVTTRNHPELPYLIYNYSKKTTYEQHWDDITETARGVIVNYDTGKVVARPLRKFYNWEEPRGHHPHADTRVTAFDKLDGSLGILYPDPAQRFGYAVATRGSFVSDQAVWATKWLNDQDEFPWKLRGGLRHEFTPLVEIIYPDNRIVLDYGNRESLVYLGEVAIEKGEFTWFPEDWNGEHAAIIYDGPARNLDLFARRDNAEGVVVYDWTARKHVKLKQQDYLELHKLVSGLNERSVYEALRHQDDTHWDDWIRKIPEEFQTWANGVAVKLVQEFVQSANVYARKLNELLDHFHISYEDLPSQQRSLLASYINSPDSGWEKHEKGAFWLDVDKRDNSAIFWKQVENNIRERNKSE